MTENKIAPSWVQTHSGRKFNLFGSGFRCDEIDITDIAHSLSMQCRFNGHCNEFYSVAQHCVNVWRYGFLYRGAVSPTINRRGDKNTQLHLLLHDAAEAYLSDLISPVKHIKTMKPYRDLEDRILSRILCRFGVVPTDASNDAMAHSDKGLLMSEALVLFDSIDLLKDWEVFRLEELPTMEFAERDVGEFLSPKRSKDLFLETYKHIQRLK